MLRTLGAVLLAAVFLGTTYTTSGSLAGTVVSADGGRVVVRTAGGRTVGVRLTATTVIRPAGTRLERGSPVRITVLPNGTAAAVDGRAAALPGSVNVWYGNAGGASARGRHRRPAPRRRGASPAPRTGAVPESAVPRRAPRRPPASPAANRRYPS